MKVKVWFLPIIFPPFLQFHKSDSRSSIATCGKGLPYWTELIQNISTTAKNSIGQKCCRGEKAQEAGEPMETKTQIVPGAWKWSSDPWLSEVMLLWVSFLYLLAACFFFFFFSRRVERLPQLSWQKGLQLEGHPVKSWERCNTCTSSGLRLGRKGLPPRTVER